MANKGIFVSTRIKGTPVSFVSTVDLENGMLIERGAIVTGKNQVYNAVAPTGNKEVYVVGNPAWSYDNSSIINQNEDEYVIPAGTEFRAYPLDGKGEPDRFTVADYSMSGASSVVEGNTVGLTAGSNKATIGGTTSAFEGVVVKVDNQGFEYYVGKTVDTRVKLVTIEVVRNDVPATVTP